MKKVWNSIKDYVYIVLAVLIIRTYIVTPAIVDGDSMNNTLLDGQIVILNKITYRFNDVNRFDIVVIENREDNDKIIKRIIGLPNEKIRYIDNKLYVNDKLIETNLSFKDTKDFEYETKNDEYFVLGDNRVVSKDSRILGNFKKEDIVGKVSIRIYPLDRIGSIK